MLSTPKRVCAPELDTLKAPVEFGVVEVKIGMVFTFPLRKRLSKVALAKWAPPVLEEVERGVVVLPRTSVPFLVVEIVAALLPIIIQLLIVVLVLAPMPILLLPDEPLFKELIPMPILFIPVVLSRRAS